MGINASSQAISGMRSDIQAAIREIQEISAQITAAGRPPGEWNDTQSQQYGSAMSKAAKATTQPLDTLKQAIPKLNKLEEALNQYGSVRFR